MKRMLFLAAQQLAVSLAGPGACARGNPLEQLHYGAQAPASIYRCKGVVHAAEEPGRRVILQVVGKRVDIVVGDEWSGQARRTRIVANGAHDGVDGAALREVFDRCRTSDCQK